MISAIIQVVIMNALLIVVVHTYESSPLVIIHSGRKNSWVISNGVLHFIQPQEIEMLKSQNVPHIMQFMDVAERLLCCPIGEPWHKVVNKTISSNVDDPQAFYYSKVHEGLWPRAQSGEDKWLVSMGILIHTSFG
jgi:hypothetical protein